MPLWPPYVRPLSGKQVNDVLSMSHWTAFHCWAAWNAHDYYFAKQLAIIPSLGDTIELYSVNVEDPANAPLTIEWEILNVPALVIFHDGKRLRTFDQGRESVDELIQRVAGWLERIGAGGPLNQTT